MEEAQRIVTQMGEDEERGRQFLTEVRQQGAAGIERFRQLMWDYLQAAEDDLAELVKLRDQLEVVRAYAALIEDGRRLQNAAAEMKLRTERRLGEVLLGMPKNAGAATRSTERTALPTLSELGLTKNQSSEAQRIARIPEGDFTRHLDEQWNNGGTVSQDRVLELAKALERQARTVRRETREAEQRARPWTALPDGVRLEVADAVALPLEDDQADLILTSPPYGLDKPYAGGVDPSDGWGDWMEAWLSEAYRVTKPHGRLALNVPLDTTRGGYRPTYAEAILAAVLAGWTYRTTIVWWDDNARSLGRGSVDSYTAPHLYAPVEMLVLASKGEWQQEPRGESDDTHDAFLARSQAVWKFPGESHAWEGHPAAFPEELPRRLIPALTARGDLVVDPFLGSGTTAVVAARLGRRVFGSDQSAEYLASSRRRLAAEEQGELF